MERPLILVSNDDGVRARGCVRLREAMAQVGDAYTVAPEREQSANSHSLTLHRPLRHRQLEEGVHAIDGTPADCVYVALYHGTLLPRRPDLVVSGINSGPNLGSDTHYSGTVAAAREGALRGIPSIAFSNFGDLDLDIAGDIAAKIARRLLSATQPPGSPVLLNVNFPPTPPKGVRATRLGRRLYADEVLVRNDPRGREYIWIGGPGARHEHFEGSDTEAIEDGYVSVTPLMIDVTHAEHLGLAAWVASEEATEPEST
jgi:5'-nucleotidase